MGKTSSRYSRSSRSLPLPHRLARVAVGGGDDAHVDRDRLGRPDARHGARLEHAQQPHLQLERHLGDLVEEQRAAMGALEVARVLARRAGEAPLLVAEQLALDQRSGETAPQLSARYGRARAGWLVQALATSSLPVPLSPMMSTVASLRPMRARSGASRFISGDSPIRAGRGRATLCLARRRREARSIAVSAWTTTWIVANPIARARGAPVWSWLSADAYERQKNGRQWHTLAARNGTTASASPYALVHPACGYRASLRARGAAGADDPAIACVATHRRTLRKHRAASSVYGGGARAAREMRTNRNSFR